MGKTCGGLEEGKPLGLVHFFSHQAQLILDQEETTYHLEEVKATQGWLEEVATLFEGPGKPELVVVEKGHGRSEHREVGTSGELAG
jgi:hypothetical protein